MLVLHHATYSINSLCHFFGTPALQDRRRVPQPRGGCRSSPSARRGTTTITRSPPRPATVSGAGSSIPPRGSSGRSRRPAWRGTSCASPPSARPPSSRRERDGGLRAALAEALPDRPFTVDLWDGTHAAVDQRRRRADVPDHLARGARPRAARAGAARRRPRVRERRDRRRRHRRGARAARAAGRRRRSTRARSAGSRSAAVKRGRAAARAEGAGDGAAPEGPAPLDPARQARGHAPLQPLQRVLLAVPRRVDDVLVRDLVARGDDARGGAADQARARLHEARRCSRASACSTSAAAGARSRSTPRASTASTSPGSRSERAAGGAGARARARRPGWPTGSTSASWTTARSRARRSTRSPRSAWSSTSAA